MDLDIRIKSENRPVYGLPVRREHTRLTATWKFRMLMMKKEKKNKNKKKK